MNHAKQISTNLNKAINVCAYRDGTKTICVEIWYHITIGWVVTIQAPFPTNRFCNVAENRRTRCRTVAFLSRSFSDTVGHGRKSPYIDEYEPLVAIMLSYKVITVHNGVIITLTPTLMVIIIK